MLRYTDPSGYIKTAPPEPGVILNPGWLRYAGYGHHSSSWFQQEFEAGKNGTGAEGNYGRPGEGDNGTGLGGIYYDYVSGTYRDVNTYQEVSQEVFINVIENHRDARVTWLYFSGPAENPFLTLTGFELSNGIVVDFSEDPDGNGGFLTKAATWWAKASGRCEPDNSEYLFIGAFQLLRSLGSGILPSLAARGGSWAKTSGILRDAAKGKGNYWLGTGTYNEAMQAGRSWVGEGFAISRDGSSWISSNGLRQFRPPSFKPKWGIEQANFQWRNVSKGPWQSNGHLDIIKP